MTDKELEDLKNRLNERCVDGEGINVTKEDVERLLIERADLLEAGRAFVDRAKELNVHMTASEVKARNAIWKAES